MGERDAHPLTEEQLDALVDELQDRLGDSTARTYGRRGVLAALGVAALGTGSASAQASGSVGTASNPVDVEGYDVTASNSFTDPAGVTHSGELADLSDVGSGTGQWQEVNSGSNIEPIDGETVGTGSEDVDVGSVSAENQLIKSSVPQICLDGHVVVVQPTEGVNAAIDVSATSTPISDALSVIAGQAGLILLPPGTVQEAGSADPADGSRVSIIGTGHASSLSTPGTLIQFTSTGTSAHGFVLDDKNDDFRLENVTVEGPGSGQTTGHAIEFQGPTRAPSFRNVAFRGWGTDVIHTTSTAKVFESYWENISMWDYSGGGMFLDGLGPSNYATDLRFTGGEYCIDQRSGVFVIDAINVGGDIGAGGPSSEAFRTHGGLHIGTLNFEPSGSFNGSRILYHKFADTAVSVQHIDNRATVDYVISLAQSGGGWYGTIDNNGTINNARIEINTGMADHSFYIGPSADIQDNTGLSTGLLRSLGSAGTGNG